MGLLQLIPTAALTFAPPFIYYTATPLAEYGAAPSFSSGLVAKIMTSTIKLVLWGLTLGSDALANNNFAQVVVNSLVGLVDIAGFWFALTKLQQRHISTSHRFQAVGAGWTLGDCLLHRLIPLWKGTRTPDFSPMNLRIAMEANIALVYFLSFAAVTSLLWSRRSKPPKVQQVLQFWAVGHALLPVGLQLLQQHKPIPDLPYVGLQFAVVAALAFSVWRLYVLCGTSTGINKSQ